MDKKILTEIKRIKELAEIKESVVNEGLLDDLKTFFSTASQDMLKRDDVIKLKSLYNELITGEKSADSFEMSDIDANNINDIQFYESILKCLGAPKTKENVMFLFAWRQVEGGEARFNPFNTTWNKPNATNYTKRGIKNYQSLEDGISATCNTLKQNNFTSIRNGFINNVGLVKLAELVGNSNWGTEKTLLMKVINGYLRGNTPKPKPIKR